MLETVLKNQLIKISVEQNYHDKTYYISYIGRSRFGKWEYELSPTKFYSIEEAVSYVAEKIAIFVLKDLEEQEQLEEYKEEYYEQLITTDCSCLYEYLRDCTNYFNGYKKLVVNKNMTLKELKKWAKKCRIKSYSKYNSNNKNELVKKINDYNLAIKA